MYLCIFVTTSNQRRSHYAGQGIKRNLFCKTIPNLIAPKKEMPVLLLYENIQTDIYLYNIKLYIILSLLYLKVKMCQF